MSALERARTLAELLLARADDVDGDRAAITFLRNGAVRATVTGRELLERAQLVATVLVEHGVRPGDRVLLLLTSQQQVVEAFFGAVWCGALPVPLAPPMVAADVEVLAARLSGIVARAEPRLALVSRELAGPARALAAALGGGGADALPVLEPSDWQGSGARLETPARRSADDLCFLQFTSGSTGTPRGVALSHKNVLHNVGAICMATRFGRDDVGVSWLPLYHDMGLIGGLLATLRAGAHLISLSPVEFAKRPVSWLHAISAYRGTLSPAPHFAYRRCLELPDAELDGLDLSSWRIAFDGAEPIDQATLERFAHRFGAYGLPKAALFPVYGLAEHTLAVTFPRLGSMPSQECIDGDILARQGRAVVVAEGAARTLVIVGVGAPLPGVEVEIRRDGVPVADGEVGDIHVRSDSVMQQYYGDAAATAEALAGGWLATGDLGYLRNGELFVTGRKKELIIIAGRNYAPSDLEAAAAEVEGVRVGRVAAFAVSGDDGEGAVVIAECEDAAPTSLVDSIAANIAARVGVRPRDVRVVPRGSLPVTSSGKVQRGTTRDRYLAELTPQGPLPA